jgi:hypothetical protein
MSKKSYDTRCHDLALVFLDDEGVKTPVLERAADRLAEQLQDLIEDFLVYELSEMRVQHRQEMRDREEQAKEEAALLRRQE